MAINPPLAGGSPWYHYRYYDAAFFAQDQWRVRRNFSLTYGLRYELPRSPASDLLRNNQRLRTPRDATQGIPSGRFQGEMGKIGRRGLDSATNFRSRRLAGTRLWRG
jgi:hypothetical protein